jgi:hypothetical protein
MSFVWSSVGGFLFRAHRVIRLCSVSAAVSAGTSCCTTPLKVFGAVREFQFGSFIWVLGFGGCFCFRAP